MPTDLIARVREVAEPIIKEQNLELIDIESLQERGRWILRLIIDKEKGVTLDDCTKVSRELGFVLDIKDFLPQTYHLEVSSPGLNRPLKTINDFKKYLGHKVNIKTSKTLGGRKNFKGILRSVEGDLLRVDIEGTGYEILLNEVVKANLIYEFPEKGMPL